MRLLNKVAIVTGASLGIGSAIAKRFGHEGAKVAVPTVAVIGLLACLVFLVWSTVIKRGGAFKSSDGAKKIFISFLQLQ